MRTVHETEALRPSDPVPKSMQSHGGTKGKQLKIVLKTPQSHATSQDDGADDADGNDDIGAEFCTPLTEQQGFTSKELALDTGSLLKICIANVKWATKEGESLRKECKELQQVYKKEWLEKEVLVDQVAQVEEDYWTRRQAVLAAEARLAKAEAELAAKTERAIGSVEDDDQITIDAREAAEDAEDEAMAQEAADEAADEAAEEAADEAMEEAMEEEAVEEATED